MQNHIIARLKHALEQHHLPGLSVVIRQHNKDRFAGGLGYFDTAGRCPVDEKTQYGVASLSKLVTTILVLLLQERGVLSVDDSLVRYFPSLKVAQDAPITLAHLLSHSAGFPGLPGRFYARNIDDINDRSGGVGRRGSNMASSLLADFPDLPTIVDATELVELMNRLDFDQLAQPGDLLNYSNEGFCLLGGVIQQVTRRPYTELVHELVFAPLQMDRTYFGEPGLQATDSLALPLVRDGDGYRTAAFWQAPLFYPAGGCISSASDIASLIGALAATAPLLCEESKKRISHPQIPVASRPDPGIAYGFGLEVQRIDAETTLLWHSGQRVGVSSFMGYLTEHQMAVSVLCNVADAPVTSIAHELIGDVLSRSDIRWPPVAFTPTAQAGVADRFVGRYASDEGNDYVVKQSGDALVLSNAASSQSHPLQFVGSDYGTVGTQTFRFLSVPLQSHAWALALDLRVLQRA